MNTLIVKLNATGDVVRTTTVLHRLAGDVTWITAKMNVELLVGCSARLRCLAWEDRGLALDRSYDLVINLEDEADTATFVSQVQHAQRFGAYMGDSGSILYTDSSRQWFDLSLISQYGRTRADELKLQNRETYQDLIFRGLGWRFENERYLLSPSTPTDLEGDVAIAPVAGPVWPNKGWAYYDDLKRKLEAKGLRVNILSRRATLREHMRDVESHRCLVSGDSLPMHLALATGTRCVTLFNCTSPWEICDYGLQTKVVSPLLEKYFYKREMDAAAMSAISLEEVHQSVIQQLDNAAATRPTPHSRERTDR
jgi:lipopolysaccharide heptosyltransferase II